MSEDVREEAAQRSERRAFLEQCGRFAVVTPPIVALMLTVGDKAALATSGNSTATTTTTVTSDITVTTSITSTATVTTFLTPVMLPDPGSQSRASRLAAIVDSMGLMKS